MTGTLQQKTALPWVLDDGGRAAAGFKGRTGDCVTRAIAIATGAPYIDVYRAMNAAGKATDNGYGRRRSTARRGMYADAYGPYLIARGWEYISYALGPVKHLAVEDMPDTPVFIAALKRHHLTAVVDGVAHDTWNASDRHGNGRLSRVAGIWIPGGAR